FPEIDQGNEYFKRGDSLKAQENYGKAVARAGTMADLAPKAKGRAHYALGVAYAVNGDYDNALEQLDKAYAAYQDSDWLDFQGRVKDWKAEAQKVEQQQKDADGPKTSSTGM